MGLWNPQIKNTSSCAKSTVGLFYGFGGCGKTTLLRSCDLILNAKGEDGLGSISSLNIPYVDITDIARPNGIIDWLEHSEQGKQAKRIGIDSLSWLVNVIFAKQTRGNRKKCTWDDWDIIRNEVDKFIVDLKSLGKEVWCTAQAQLVQDKMSQEIMGVPDIATRNYSVVVPALFDHCIRLKDTIVGKQKQIMAYFSSESYFIAKVRTPFGMKLDSYVVDVTNLTAHDISLILKGGKKEEEEDKAKIIQ